MSTAFEPGSYDFDLPEDLIAQDPPARRGDSRLLLVEPGQGAVGERVFRQLPDILRAGDLLVLNESRVLPARLLTVREDTGGRVEILLIRPASRELTWLALARPGRRLRTGTRLVIDPMGKSHEADAAVLEVAERLDEGQILVSAETDPGILAEKWGVMPLPPYIRRDPDDLGSPRARQDRDRYQTVFAVPDDSGAGSVAAPTAGLHFSRGLLESLAARQVATARVSLHVGPGTFRPPTEHQISAGRLHREYFHLPRETAARIARTRRDKGRVIAVGTTSLRVLETASRLNLSDDGPDHRFFGNEEASNVPEFAGEGVRRNGHWEVSGQTRLFLRPPDEVASVDGLLTNFHLPGSSLLMLVAALAGAETWQGVYHHAVAERMRFYSYGDCMLILPGVAGLKGS